MKSKILQELPIDSIICLPQARECSDTKKVAEMAQSLAQVGLLQPILARPADTEWAVTDGHQRLFAAKSLGWKTITAIVDEGDDAEAAVLQCQLIANMQRSDLRPVEKARAIDRLMRDTGWTAAETAEKLGVSAGLVSRLRPLRFVPADVQARIDSGQVAASTIYQICKHRNSVERAQLFQEVLAGRLTREEVIRRTRDAAPAKTHAASRTRSKTPRERVVIALGGNRSVTVAGPSLSVPAVIEWVEELLARLRSLGATATNLNELVTALGARNVSGGGQ